MGKTGAGAGTLRCTAGRHRGRGLLAWAFGLCVAGCGLDERPCGNSRSRGDVDVYTWWRAKSEQAAMDAVTKMYEASHSGSHVFHTSLDSSDAARKSVEARLQERLPPDTFQINIGAALFPWVQSPPIVAPLGSTLLDVNWTQLQPELLSAVSSASGAIYCLPIDVHRTNTLFYNKKLLNTLPEGQRAPPTTLDELENDCKLLVAQHITPIVLPLQKNESNLWPLSSLIHENLLPALAGPAAYNEFWTGKMSDEKVRSTLTAVYQKVIDWFQLGYIVPVNASWNVVANREFLGPDHEAAFFVMGDWAKGELESMNFNAGTEFGSVGFPPQATPTGTPQRAFVFTADCFPLTLAPAYTSTGGTDLLTTFGQLDAQLAFAQKKGSLPALDVPVPEAQLDPTQQATYRDFHDDPSTSRVLAVSGLERPGALRDYSHTLLNMLESGDIHWGLRFWKGWYGQLKESQP